MWKRLPNKREILSWCFFDFANSAFTTIIITIVYSVYFRNIIAAGRTDGDRLWALGNTISQILVLLSAPLLGAIADFSASKKKFLFVSYLLCVTFTGLLTFTSQGEILFALVLFIVANFAFSSGENLIASFLPEIARPEDMGKISGFGWALGYIGGLLSLVLCFPFLKPGFGMENAPNLRMTNLVVAAFFLLAGIPTFLWVRERKKSSDLPPGRSYVSVGLERIRETFAHIRRFRELFRFLVLFGIYNCGVTTVVVFAAIYAVETIQLTPGEFLLFFLITQISASVGAFLFGLVQDRIGAKNTIYATLMIWLATIAGAYFSTDRTTFFIVGNLAGLGLGSSQSAARALVGMFSPVEKSAEFFGFWGLFWKLSTAVGPLVFGLLSSGTGNQRIAILATGIFFVIGIAGLRFINEKAGVAAARAYTASSAAPDPQL
jgi:MFS transporter, UMF1 family